MKPEPPKNPWTLLGRELRARGMPWMPMSFQAAPVWWGRVMGHAANDSWKDPPTHPNCRCKLDPS